MNFGNSKLSKCEFLEEECGFLPQCGKEDNYLGIGFQSVRKLQNYLKMQNWMWILPSASCLIWVAVLSISSASASILALHSDSTACTFLVHCSTIKHRRFTLQQVHYFLMLSLTYLILNILTKKKTNALAQESKVWQTAKPF